MCVSGLWVFFWGGKACVVYVCCFLVWFACLLACLLACLSACLCVCLLACSLGLFACWILACNPYPMLDHAAWSMPRQVLPLFYAINRVIHLGDYVMSVVLLLQGPPTRCSGS